MSSKRRTLSSVALAGIAASIVLSPSHAQGAPQNAPAAPSFPAGLRSIPKGDVTLGMTAKDLVASLALLHRNKKPKIKDTRRLMSSLVEVNKPTALPAFFLSEHPITMAQYKVFVEATGHRFPYDWWFYGCKDDFDKRRTEITKEFKDQENKNILFWQAHWKELPSKIPSDQISRNKSVPMDDYPVVFVSWLDAVAFCAWAGMRLPTEAEWTRAARGDAANNFVWGTELKGLGIKRGSRYDKPWPVGKWGQMAQGPFGHQDMVLGVWEWTGDSGFFPLTKNDAFKKERKRLLKDKLFKLDKRKDNAVVKRLLEELPTYEPKFSGSRHVAKGGWQGSKKAELMINMRAPMADYQTLGGLGFRVAKSLRPGYDTALSMLRLDYDISYFGEDREPNLKDHAGCEYYELSKDGKLIKGYHAISLVPVSYVGKTSKLKMPKMLEESKQSPVVIGSLILTEKASVPAIDSGIYTVHYRQMGLPKDLTQALKGATKAIKKAAKNKGKGKEGDKKKPAKKKGKGPSWESVLSRYGITEEDVLSGETIDFIRMKPGKLKVSATQHRFVLRDAQGNWVASYPASAPPQAISKYEPGTSKITITPEKDGSETLRATFGVPRYKGSKDKVYLFKLDVKLPKESAGQSKWRTE